MSGFVIKYRLHSFCPWNSSAMLTMALISFSVLLEVKCQMLFLMAFLQSPHLYIYPVISLDLLIEHKRWYLLYSLLNTPFAALSVKVGSQCCLTLVLLILPLFPHFELIIVLDLIIGHSDVLMDGK